MIRRLMHVFALSEKGAKDFVKAVIWCFVCNISLMLPVGVVIGTIQYLMNALETGGDPMDQIWLYTGLGVVTVVVLFVLHYFQYASLYLATYKESASRRVSLAETLRKLPLSFFGNRDLHYDRRLFQSGSDVFPLYSPAFRLDFFDAVHRNLYVVY